MNDVIADTDTRVHGAVKCKACGKAMTFYKNEWGAYETLCNHCLALAFQDYGEEYYEGLWLERNYMEQFSDQV